jgi:peptide/nickel transport system substrate-binding protein
MAADKLRKLRLGRRFKRSQKHVESIGQQAEAGLEKHFFGRLGRFVGVRRFVFAWIMLLALLVGGVIVQTRGLSRYFQQLSPAEGGTYTEGVLGSFTNANPIYATGPVDSTVAKLLFSSIMQYDSNNKLVGDLALKLSFNRQADVYTIKLRDNVYWHDGKPLTAEDVVFTYETIQNSDAQSPLLPNWKGVKIKAINSHTVEFDLPHALASFPHSLTSGIVPKHLLSNIPASQLRSVSFNTANPIGSGPFKWDSIQVDGSTLETREEQIGLIKNEQYYLGAPKLDRFTVRAFRNDEALITSMNNKEITGAAGLDNMPDNKSNDLSTKQYSVPLMGEIMVFLKNSDEILKDANVRRALTKGTDVNEIIAGLGYPVIKSDSLLLRSHTGYNKKITQQAYNPKQAKLLLKKSGWVKINDKGIRTKKGQELTVRMFSRSNSQYSYVTSVLQKQWRAIGVKLDVALQSDEELQSTIAFHNYQALLYGISLGNDPDIYAYWHSSQADAGSSGRLNLAEYKSNILDQALEGGRSRVDPKLRATKYKPMLAQWRTDAPAIALYQPRYLYITSDSVQGFMPTKFVSPTDRFANIVNWTIKEAPKTRD